MTVLHRNSTRVALSQCFNVFEENYYTDILLNSVGGKQGSVTW